MKIKKGRHYGTPFPFPKCLSRFKLNLGTAKVDEETDEIKNRLIFWDTKWLSFDESIRYFLNAEDQADVNKLFGFSYGYHHNNSDRIGFRYNTELGNVELILYSYVNKQRIPSMLIGTVEIGEPFTVTLRVELYDDKRVVTAKIVPMREDANREYENVKTYSISIDDIKSKNKFIKYSLGLYFGGNNVAPHDILIHEYEKKDGKIIEKI